MEGMGNVFFLVYWMDSLDHILKNIPIYDYPEFLKIDFNIFPSNFFCKINFIKMSFGKYCDILQPCMFFMSSYSNFFFPDLHGGYPCKTTVLLASCFRVTI